MAKVCAYFFLCVDKAEKGIWQCRNGINIKGIGAMERVNRRITPENVTSLSRCEIFVFGSNLEGLHYGGAAKVAYEKFGAEWGVGVGRTGQCYAIPTMHGGLKAIRPYVRTSMFGAKRMSGNSSTTKPLWRRFFEMNARDAAMPTRRFLQGLPRAEKTLTAR